MSDEILSSKNHIKRSKKRLIRDMGGSVDLNDGTGGIICMRKVDDYLEIFKIDMIFKFYHPNSIDPERNNPDLKPLIKKIYKGTSNIIIARGYLQLYDLLQALPIKRSINIDKIIALLRESRDNLLDCEDAFLRFKENYDICIKKIKENKLGELGNVYTDFPTINSLNEITTSYLINAKRFICIQVKIFNAFFNTTIKGSRTDLIIKWLKKNLNEEKEFIKFLEEIEKPIKQIIDFRNGQEHPSKTKTLTIEDFKIQANNEISQPLWYLNESQKRNIYDDLKNIINFFISFSEIILINSAFSNLDNYPFSIRLEAKQEEDINPLCPIKYVLFAEIGNSKNVKVGNQIGYENTF